MDPVTNDNLTFTDTTPTAHCAQTTLVSLFRRLQLNAATVLAFHPRIQSSGWPGHQQEEELQRRRSLRVFTWILAVVFVWSLFVNSYLQWLADNSDFCFPFPPSLPPNSRVWRGSHSHLKHEHSTK